MGCAAQRVAIVELVAAGQRNQFKALDTYERKWLDVSGTVESMGIQGFNVVKAENPAFTWGQVTARSVREDYPYVVLVAREGTTVNRLLCYFEKDDRSEVGELTVGRPVVLRGSFQRYLQSKDGGLVPQLAGCEVVD